MTTAAAAVPTKSNGHITPPPALGPQKFEPTQMVKLELIEADPHNPRKDFPKEEMAELTASVSQLGVLQAVTLRPIAGGKFRVVAGERRFRAAKAAGLAELKAEVRQLTDIEASDIQMAENLKRADLSALEVAGGYKRQLELGRTMDQVCERAGKKRSAVYATMQLLQLGDAGRKALGEGQISASVAQLVARVPKALQEKALGMVLGTEFAEPLKYREAEAQLGSVFTVDLKKATFDTKDAKLCPAAGSCDVCPKRSGNAKDLFPELKSPDVCTDRPCYDAKVLADARKSIESKGWTMLVPQVPADELFHNAGRGPLKQESGWVDPAESCLEDAEGRAYDLLLQSDQLKKLVRVALNADGKPCMLLQRSGLMREVKKGGVFKPRKPTAPAKPKPESSSARDAKQPEAKRPAPPDVDELVDRALVEAMVAKVEEKGFTPALLRSLALYLGAGCYTLKARRFGEEHTGPTGEKKLGALIGKAKPGELAGLVFEAACGDHLEYLRGGSADELVALMGLSRKDAEAAVRKANPILWSEDSKGATGSGVKNGAEYVIERDGKSWFFTKPKDPGTLLAFDSLEKAKKQAMYVELGEAKWNAAITAVAASNAAKRTAKDPLDSPAVAKAKAKRAAAKKPAKKTKGGGK